MIITIQNLSKQYHSKAPFALDHANFEIPKGVYGLLGRNGAGKTTLLRIMASVLDKSRCIYIRDVFFFSLIYIILLYN